RAAGHEEPEEESGAEEFASIVASLRAHAVEHIADLAQEAPSGPDAESVAEALSLFDDADRAATADVTAHADERGDSRLRDAWAALAPRDAWRGLRRRAVAAHRSWTAHDGPWWRRVPGAVRAFAPLPALRSLGGRLGDGIHALCAIRDGETPWEASASWLLARPRALLVGACVAVGAVGGMFLALGADDVEQRNPVERSAAEIPAPKKRRKTTHPRRKPVKPAPRKRPRAPGPPSRDTVDQALRDVVSGTPDRRDEGEHYLIWHSDESIARVKAALKAPVAPAAKSSLRYVLASIEDKRDIGARPYVVWKRPKRGLLIFLDEINSQTTEEISKVRRTGKAEKLDVTVVYASKEDPMGIAEQYASRLGKVALYVDAERDTFKRLRINQTPAVVGMHGDGRLGFLLFGTTPRSRLAQNVARLTR
ncbi:MAG: hypothetical protein OER88_10190, partial [Planctomycetota bacterium]|nr:hypothetical protein [Planctomycetota bacterium]